MLGYTVINVGDISNTSCDMLWSRQQWLFHFTAGVSVHCIKILKYCRVKCCSFAFNIEDETAFLLFTGIIISNSSCSVLIDQLGQYSSVCNLDRLTYNISFHLQTRFRSIYVRRWVQPTNHLPIDLIFLSPQAIPKLYLRSIQDINI